MTMFNNTGKCKSSCNTTEAEYEWYGINTELGQWTPKCAWWKCSACPDCDREEQCLPWCDMQPQWIHVDSCSFKGCAACPFCAGADL
jgi:hypothetical protein